MRASWLVILIGCSRPAPRPEPTPRDTPPDIPVADALPVDAEVAVVPDAQPIVKRVIDEVEGIGACTVDADCELSSWQPGCCTGTCGNYAISTRELARRIQAAHCPKLRTKPCPPPAACAPPTHMPFDAFCKGGACWAHRHVLP